jgi:ribosomal protein S21
LRFFHFTSWDLNQFEVGAALSTYWEVSNYWSQKTRNNSVTDNAEIMNGSLPNINVFGFDLKKVLRDYKIKSELLKEMIFEEVRLERYYTAPSRKKCMFIFNEEVNYEEYAKLLGFKVDNYSVIEIEPIQGEFSHLKVDYSWLDCNLLTYDEIREFAIKYWTGEIRDSNKCETLFTGRFRLNRVIRERKIIG